MNANSQLTFHIIYVPGTVRHLRLFLLSLVEHSVSCRFRLVSNGCSPTEVQMLQRLCRQDDRLELIEVARDRPLPHGRVLTLLQQGESSGTFAFMDSDIFATSEFLSPFLERADDLDAVFSCPPIWSTPEYEVMRPEFGCLAGAYQHLDDGTCVGSSYFAIYDSERLQHCIDETGVTFDLYPWSQIPAVVQRELVDQGRQKALYDTGKLLNILLESRGCGVAHLSLPNLVHVGGISGETLSNRSDWVRTLRARLSTSLAGRVRRVIGDKSDWRQQLTSEERAWDRVKQLRRSTTCRHFSTLVQALLAGRSAEVSFDHEDSELAERVDRAQRQIANIYRKWAHRLEDSRIARAA